MNPDTRALLAKLQVITDMGCRPSIALIREIIVTVQRMDVEIADLSTRIMQLRREVARWERESQHVD